MYFSPFLFFLYYLSPLFLYFSPLFCIFTFPLCPFLVLLSIFICLYFCITRRCYVFIAFTLAIYYILARLPPVIFLISCRYVILLAVMSYHLPFFLLLSTLYALNCLPQFYFSRLFLLPIFCLSPLFCICCPSTLHLLFFLPLFLP